MNWPGGYGGVPYTQMVSSGDGAGARASGG